MQIGETEIWTDRGHAAEYGLRLANLRSVGGTLRYESPVSLNTAVFSGDCGVGYLTYIGPGSRISMADVGRYCSIAPDVIVGAAEHPLDWVSTHPFQYDGTRQFAGLEEYELIARRNSFQKNNKRTTIGNDVLIGDGAFIKRGIIVGHGAIIGARAVVTQDVAPYTIVAGNPARPIRDRFSRSLASKLIESVWWEYDLRECPPGVFKDPESFLNALDISLAEGLIIKLSPKSYSVSGGSSTVVTRIS